MINLTLVLCCLGCLSLGAIILLRDTRKLTNMLFGGITVCFAIWIAAILLFIRAKSADDAFIFAKIFYAAATIFPLLLVLFAIRFPRPIRMPGSVKIALIAGTSSILLPLLLVPNFITDMVVIDSGGNYVVLDHLSYLAFSAYFIGYFFGGISVALHKMTKLKSNERMQAGLYAFGILINSVPGFFTNLILPYFQNYKYIWVGPVASIFFLALTGYAIARHRMFDIRLVLARSVAYLLVLATMVGFYGFAIYVIYGVLFLRSDFTAPQFIANVLIAITLAMTYPPLKRFFDKITDRIFFKNTYDLQSALNRMSDITVEETKLSRIISSVRELILETVKPESVTIVVFDKDGAVAKVAGDKNCGDHSESFGKLTKTQSVIYTEDDSEIVSDYGSALPSVVARMQTSTQLVGYIIVGGKKSGEAYRKNDRHLVQSITDELSVAAQNALRFDEIQSFNKTLEEKVSEATEELRRTNRKLHQIDKTKDEFISMASHQLRTPLTTVKGYISMVLDGDVGKITPAQRKALEEAYNSSQRMVYLIGDFLNVSRLQTGKFELECSEVNIADIIEEEIAQLRNSAFARGVELVYKAPKDFPTISLDENKIRQVIMNFIDNAIYYSLPGAKVRVKLEALEFDVMFTVTDEGIGVPADEQPRLFTKFFRAENAKKQRPDGTGIGLYMAKKVVDAHKGKIIFSSQEGRGSTFGFTVPVQRN